MLVAGGLEAAGLQRRDHGSDAVAGEAVGVVAAVEEGGFENVFDGELVPEGLELASVVGVALGGQQGDAGPLVEDGGVDFGAPLAPRAAQSQLSGLCGDTVFLGAPAA